MHLLSFATALPAVARFQQDLIVRLDRQEILAPLYSASPMNMAKVRNGPAFITELHGLKVFSANSPVNLAHYQE